METLQIKLDSATKKAADLLFESLGLDTLTAVKMFIAASLDAQGIPFAVKKKHDATKLNDEDGSYICKYGHLHNYSRFKFEDYEKELAIAKAYTTLSEMWADLDAKGIDNEI